MYVSKSKPLYSRGIIAAKLVKSFENSELSDYVKSNPF